MGRKTRRAFVSVLLVYLAACASEQRIYEGPEVSSTQTSLIQKTGDYCIVQKVDKTNLGLLGPSARVLPGQHIVYVGPNGLFLRYSNASDSPKGGLYYYRVELIVEAGKSYKFGFTKGISGQNLYIDNSQVCAYEVGDTEKRPMACSESIVLDLTGEIRL